MHKLKNMKKEKRGKNKGFTVVELLISMAIFVIITSITIISFVRTLRAQQAIVGLIAANDNASLTLEQMAREIRTGSNFSTNGSSLSFNGPRGEQIVYRLTDGRIEKGSAGQFAPLTASNVRVDRLEFYLLRNDANNRPIQPRITIVLRTSSPTRDINKTYTDIQTTISPRVLN